MNNFLNRSKYLLGTLLLGIAIMMVSLDAVANDVRPPPFCAEEAAMPYPAFADIDNPPNVLVSKNLGSLPSNCHLSVNVPIVLTVALASKFRHEGTLEEIAEQLGAISTMQDIKYWSVSNQKWRALISDAVALTENNNKAIRKNFTGSEVLSGDTLYFAQNDSRSWGFNVYSLKTIESSADRAVFISQNISPVKLGPITLFKPGDAQTVIVVEKLNTNTWSYYSVAALQNKSAASNEKSLINRQAAFYRYLTGIATDMEPPLAP